ncbi:hypothetical protein, partial [Vibrio parahaemolyticus]
LSLTTVFVFSSRLSAMNLFLCRFFSATTNLKRDYYTDAFRWVLKQSFLTKTAEKVFSASPI